MSVPMPTRARASAPNMDGEALMYLFTPWSESVDVAEVEVEFRRWNVAGELEDD